MAEFAYTTVPGKISQLLNKLREVGVPLKVSQQWLKTIGFTSSNDGTLIGVLKQVGLIDASSIPTGIWSSYRGSDHKKILAKAIREGYAELFAVYPDAPSRSATELEHVFSTSSSAGKQVIGKTVSTFKALTEIAEFSDQPEETKLSVATNTLHQSIGAAGGKGPETERGSRTPSVHIDVQIHIAPEASSEQIDQIFRSMAKHLYGVRDSE